MRKKKAAGLTGEERKNYEKKASGSIPGAVVAFTIAAGIGLNYFILTMIK